MTHIFSGIVSCIVLYCTSSINFKKTLMRLVLKLRRTDCAYSVIWICAVCVCVCMYACIYVCIYIYISMYDVCVCIHVYTCMYKWIKYVCILCIYMNETSLSPTNIHRSWLNTSQIKRIIVYFM